MIRVGFVGVGNIPRHRFTALATLPARAGVVAVCDDAGALGTPRVVLAANQSARSGQPVRLG